MKNLNHVVLACIVLSFAGCGRSVKTKFTTKFKADTLIKPVTDALGCIMIHPLVVLTQANDNDIKFYQSTYDKVSLEIRNKKDVTHKNFWESLSKETRDLLTYELNVILLNNPRWDEAEVYKSTAYFFTMTNVVFDYQAQYKLKDKDYDIYTFKIRGQKVRAMYQISGDCTGNKKLDLDEVSIEPLKEFRVSNLKGAYQCRTQKDGFIFMEGTSSLLLKTQDQLLTLKSENSKKTENIFRRQLIIENPELSINLKLSNLRGQDDVEVNGLKGDKSQIDLKTGNIDIHDTGVCRAFRKFSEFSK